MDGPHPGESIRRAGAISRVKFVTLGPFPPLDGILLGSVPGERSTAAGLPLRTSRAPAVLKMKREVDCCIPFARCPLADTLPSDRELPARRGGSRLGAAKSGETKPRRAKCDTGSAPCLQNAVPDPPKLARGSKFSLELA